MKKGRKAKRLFLFLIRRTIGANKYLFNLKWHFRVNIRGVYIACQIASSKAMEENMKNSEEMRMLRAVIKRKYADIPKNRKLL